MIERQVVITTNERVVLEGDLNVPEGASSVVIFAHCSGSSRHSPRNRYVATQLRRVCLATLLVDLLTAEEEQAERWTGHMRFDIDLLADRLLDATRWVARNEITRHLAIGYFGASTGAAAALRCEKRLEIVPEGEEDQTGKVNPRAASSGHRLPRAASAAGRTPPSPLQLKATSKDSWQRSHFTCAKPYRSTPHSRCRRTSFSTGSASRLRSAPGLP